MKNSKKANIYIDCVGNVETDIYYKESEIPKLKEFLESIGYEVEAIVHHKESKEVGKHFIDKPRIMKTISHDVDWDNPKVIFKILNEGYKDNEVLLKECLKESGIDPEKSNSTPFTIIARSRDISQKYERWKIENKFKENDENKNKLYLDFSDFYVEEEKKKRQKRLQPGTEVYITTEDKKGIVKEYKEDKGIYVVEDVDGYQARYKRKDLMIEEGIKLTDAGKIARL